MSSWTSGYVADLAYTHGFYRELAPSFLNLTALVNGVEGPFTGQPLNYCELGCGQGFSINLLAAANPNIRFYATDFNPAQIAGARTLALEAGLANVTFYDRAFSEFADAPSLPEQFDIIALHGIYSWVSRDNRAAIVDFIRRKLKVGGLVYISYNCLPGWSSAAPLRQLMYLHAKTQSGPTIARLQSALEFVGRMQDAGAGYFRSVPGIAERFEMIREQSRNYLAHEYLNDTWEPFYHADVARDLDAAKLTFVGSAALLEQIDAINLTAEQQKIIGDIADLSLRETARDYLLNRQFRRDIFVKGPVTLTPRLAREAWSRQRFAMSARRADIAMTVKGTLGAAELQPQVYGPLLDRFSDGPATVEELLSIAVVKSMGWARLQQALSVLTGAGTLQPCLPEEAEAIARKGTNAFNQAVIQRAQDNADLQFLASPVTGSGVAIGRFQQLFLLACHQGRSSPRDWSEFAWQIISGQGQAIIKEGKPLETEDANIAELNVQAQSFAEKQLPVLQGLGVAQGLSPRPLV